MNGLPHKLHIQGNTTVIDLLVDVIFIPHAVRHGIFDKPSLYGHFGLHIADVIFLERQPLIRRMSRKITGTMTVGLGRRTGLTEIFDEVFASGQFLLLKPQHRTDAFQRKRQTHRRSPDHRAFPRGRRKVVSGRKPKKAGQADALKVCVKCPLGNGIVLKRGNDLGGDLFSAGKVDLLHGIAVHAVGKK